jgi:hypothetical protein
MAADLRSRGVAQATLRGFAAMRAPVGLRYTSGNTSTARTAGP